MMNLLVTGGTGFIGQSLVAELLKQGHRVTVLTRNRARAEQLLGGSVALISEFSSWQDGLPLEGVINLAGEPIVDKRWTDARKASLISSRITLTQKLLSWLKSSDHKPQVMISGSAIGYYGYHEMNEALTESSEPGVDFAAALCRDWEAAAAAVEDIGTRLSLIRIGVVLGARGGALKRMLPPFRLGLGGPIGSGSQPFSWVHKEDLVGIILWLLNNEEARGVYNATAPQPVTNEAFSKTLAQHLKRPALFRVPACVLRTAMGESADLLLKGQAVYPKRLEDEGFNFIYPTISEALKECLE